jgi:hypothetical protein
MSLDIIMKELDSKEKIFAFANYLDGLENRIRAERVGILFNYLESYSQLFYYNQSTQVKKRTIKGKTRFLIETPEEHIEINKDTVDDFSLLEEDAYNAPGFLKLREIQHEVVQLYHHMTKSDKIDVEGIKYHSQKNKVAPNDFGYEAYLNERLSQEPNFIGRKFGGASRALAKKNSNQVKKDLRAIVLGGIAAVGLSFLISTIQPPHYESTGDATNSSASGSGSGEDYDGSSKRWSPDGKTLPAPSEKPANPQETEDFQQKQNQLLNSGSNSPPQRMNDVREAYLALTNNNYNAISNRADLGEPEQFFLPKELPPYAVAPNAIEFPTPEIENPGRSLLLVMDVSGSMKNPQEILTDPEAASPGYLLATQLIKNYSNLGRTLRIIRYPMGKVNDESIFETNSQDAALQELLYNNAGADDTSAVDAVAVLYITVANQRNLEPLDVVYITDAGPTTQSAAKFAQLHEDNRNKDQIYWVNCGDINVDSYQAVVKQMETLGPGYECFALRDLQGVEIVTDKIMEGLEK